MSVDEILRPSGIGTETVLPSRRPNLSEDQIRKAAQLAGLEGFGDPALVTPPRNEEVQ
jgi:hypothetical protein